MQREVRAFQADELRVERRADEAPRIVGHAAVFNARARIAGMFEEEIKAGAFREAIAEDDVRALWNHNADIVLGRNVSGTLALREDRTGLAVDIQPPDTQAARDLLTSIERGDVSGMSFAFSVRPGGEAWGEEDDGTLVRTLTNLRLWDVSPVTYPAYEQTDVAVRSLEAWQTERGVPGGEAPDDADTAVPPALAHRRRRVEIAAQEG